MRCHSRHLENRQCRTDVSREVAVAAFDHFSGGVKQTITREFELVLRFAICHFFKSNCVKFYIKSNRMQGVQTDVAVTSSKMIQLQYKTNHSSYLPITA